MNETITASPLAWPVGWKRTPDYGRIEASFHRSGRRLSVSDASIRVLEELRRMKIARDDVVISTHLTLRLDGMPRSDQAEPGDPGTAVYWIASDKSRKVMAIDIYNRVADNIAAVAASLEALRAIERHGGAKVLERAFTGFTALPAPGVKKAWHEVFGVAEHTATDDVKAAYRVATLAAHPDRPGGSHDRMAELTAAWREFKDERGVV